MTKNESINTDTTENSENYFFRASAEDFKKIPGSPIAYWVSEAFFNCFENNPATSERLALKAGMSTGNNIIFQRSWHEISIKNIGFFIVDIKETETNRIKWYPCHSGGKFRKWYGNHDVLVNWHNNGYDIRNFGRETGKLRSAVRNESFYFKQGITWSKISSGKFAARWRPTGFLFDDTGRSGFAGDHDEELLVLGLFCSNVASVFLDVLCPTLSFTSGELAKIPLNNTVKQGILVTIKALIALEQSDWDSYETSWDFTDLPLLLNEYRQNALNETLCGLHNSWQTSTEEMQRLEEENNRIFIEAYGLQDELTPDVPLEEITLTCNPYYRYGKGKTDAEYEQLQRMDTMKEFISYAIGCMMGRYSIDTPGLQFAGGEYDHAEACKNAKSFTPDDDGILPVLTDAYFEDDVTGRLVEFMVVTFGKESLSENLQFIANALGVKGHETPQDTIRRYLANNFYKDHLKTYKKRPIYWLFSSGKEKAFQALVYLHRYTPATLARMRTGYLHELQNKMRARIDDLEQSQDAAATTAQSNRTGKDITKMRKQLEELRVYDEKLHHYADQRIEIDLDDGVKHNYGLFGDLLKDVKAVTGKT